MLDVLSGVYGIMDVAGGAGGVSYLEMKRLPRGSEVDEMIGLRNRKRERERERERERGNQEKKLGVWKGRARIKIGLL